MSAPTFRGVACWSLYGRVDCQSFVVTSQEKKRKSVRKSPLDGVRLAFSHSVCVKPREERRSSDFWGAGIETERLVVGAGHTVLATWTVESHAGRSRSFVRS